MITRIEVYNKTYDARAQIRKKRLIGRGYRKISEVRLADVYTIDKKLTAPQIKDISARLINPVTQSTVKLREEFDWVIEIGYFPGVTDNVAHTTKELIEDLLKNKFSKGENVYTSQMTFITGNLTSENIKSIAESLTNPLIQKIQIKSYRQYERDGEMDIIIPAVKLSPKEDVIKVNLDVSDEELTKIGKSGIANLDGSRRGPLALDLLFMKTIQKYFQKLGRNPTDIELESLAQTWSEHCKHTIFANPLDDINEGLFNRYIKKATEEISRKKPNFCVSVFKDNSGAIAFDKDFIVTHKVETHNSPSALDPFGGSITGIVGVNRDTIGFGLGAKPIANYYGFCFADPRVDVPLYKGKNFTQKMLSSRRIMDGVIEGVNAGGNQSGIPTPQGFVYFDEKYRGKPLVFVGTVGLIPKKIKNRISYFKKAQSGDYIVMIGGRVGKDGIHGATFSSEAMDAGSPVTAVQIGDPITQKKLSDAVVKEARDQLLYHSITDNGAGGLSCSVAEMAKESDGCVVDLDKVPLKYPGMQPWEIWISESQERMTLAIPPKTWPKFRNLMARRGVESTVIGKFNHSGKCLVRYNGKIVMDIKMQFLHDGLPIRPLKSVNQKPKDSRQSIFSQKDLTKVFIKTLENLNIASYSFISQQYDHTVQGGLVLSPIQGKGQVNSEVSVIRPQLKSSRGLVLSQGLYPNYSDIDAYRMSVACIDTAFRNVVAAGADPGKIALLDNFCWCSGNDPERLAQLKQAAQGCYDCAISYRAPFISGKDSMFNDFKGFDKNGKPVKISIPPTLLITSMGIIDDITKTVSLDFKFSGDLIYLLGETYDEFGTIVPMVDAKRNLKLYQSLFLAIKKGLITSSIGVNRGGLAVALAKSTMGGMLGIEISLKNIPGKVTGDYHALFSESQGRILVSINPKNKKDFEKIFKVNSFSCIGKVLTDKKVSIKGLKGNIAVNTEVDKALKAYRKTFEGY